MQDDSIDGIFGTARLRAYVENRGRLGISVSNVERAARIFAARRARPTGWYQCSRCTTIWRYVDQGQGKRKGAAAIYIEPWHADIQRVLPMKDNQGHDEMRARDLFYALWINDLFMQRVEANGQWTLFCPSRAPGCRRCTETSFARSTKRSEREGRGSATLPARDLWATIIETQMETGGPYMLFKDACAPRATIGTSEPSTAATCAPRSCSTPPRTKSRCATLARSACQALCNGQYDFEALHTAAARLALSLDRVIDSTYYPVEAARRSNQKHRPIGIGVQGLPMSLRCSCSRTTDRKPNS